MSTSIQEGNSSHQIIPAFLPVTSIILIMGITGKFGNGFIIFSTIRHKSLHSACNILIACNALADIGHQMGIYVLAYYVFTGINYTDQQTCWYLQLVPNFFYHIGIFLTFWIGVDRLASVSIPSRYRYWNDKHRSLYLLIMLTIPNIYSLTWLFLAYEAMIVAKNNQVVCVISSFFPVSINSAHSLNNTILSVFMVIVYALTWLCVKFKKANFTQTKQVMKSLTVIMCIIIITWPISTLLFNIIKSTVALADQQTYKLYVSILLNIGLCVNFFVYFIFSRNYRVAFQKDLSSIPCLKKYLNKNSTTTVAVIGWRSQVSQMNSQQSTK